MGVVGVVAGTPGNGTALALADLTGLALEAGLVDTVFADGAVLDRDIPAPESYGVPLFYLDPFVDLHLKILYCFLTRPQGIGYYISWGLEC